MRCRLETLKIVDRDRDALENPLDDDVPFDESLETAYNKPRLSHLEKFAHDDQSGAWQNRISESNIFQSTKTHHGLAEQFVFV
jgi:hypothetical protein